VRDARVAVGDGGNVVVAWTESGPCGPRVPHQVTPQCQFVRAAVRVPGQGFGPVLTLDAGRQVVFGVPQPIADVAGRPAVWWRRSIGQSYTLVMARGRFGAGFSPAAALPGTDLPRPGGSCPATRVFGPEPRVEAVRPRPDGGAFVLVNRDEGCGALLSEIPLEPDGVPGAPVRLTPTPLARSHAFDLLALGKASPALVTRTEAGLVAVARTTAGAAFPAPTAVGVPAASRRIATSVLRDGRLVLAYSRRCRPGAHGVDAIVAPAGGGPGGAPARITRCGDPSPAIVDRTGRAVFVARRHGEIVAWNSAPL